MINSIQDETGELPEDLPKGVSPEVAAANPDVQNIIAPRLTMLMEIANSFLLTIMDSIDSVPYGIRWICKQIRSLTKVSLPLRRRAPSRADDRSHSYSASTPRRRITPSALSLVDSSSFASSTRPSLPLRPICSSTAYPPAPSTLGERSLWCVALAAKSRRAES